MSFEILDMRRSRWISTVWLLAGLILPSRPTARGDGPADNRPASVRPIPPPGIDVPAGRREKLESRLTTLNAAIETLAGRHEAKVDGLLPDVRIDARAVHDALTHKEFFRIGVRGFSMGGAACWQFAVHYADRWFAANPGAGFAETRLFLDRRMSR